MADIVLVNPRFEVSYWGLEYALPLLGKKANVPVASLPLLAAVTPSQHEVTIVDENVEPIDFERLANADIVGVTGMSVQRSRMREILEQLKDRRPFTVVGGAWVTVQEDYFDDVADAIFIGEAETTWPQFLDEWERGCHQFRYEQAERTDMTTVPPPRLDLLRMKDYLFGSIQFSRGCPYECEFCDIIVTFGRRPRYKTAEQILAELDNLRKQNITISFIVDDNVIANKKAVKRLLSHVIQWQRERRYPMTFFTEASIDLAEDEELMRLMGEANIQFVFIGIESPNEASLLETKKFQNVREKQGTLLDRVHKIQQHGIEVWCGMILGFDNDDNSIFDSQIDFVREARISFAMIGMLHAIPKTPLHARLRKEGRLDEADRPAFGTNVIPLRMPREELRDGFVRVMHELYAVEPYFQRVESLHLGGFKYPIHRNPFWRKHRFVRLYRRGLLFVGFLYLYWRLMRGVPERHLRAEYRRRIWRLMKGGRNPGLLITYVMKCAIHYHYHTLERQMAQSPEAAINVF